MDNFIKIFSVFSPFIAAYLIYLFGIKGKRKDTDLQKEKELNVVLSNLLMVWHYLSKIEIVIELLKKPNPNSIVPVKYYPAIILQSEVINDKYFQELDNSIDVLKKYDPILFYKLEGIGNSLDTIRKKLLMPFFKNPNTSPELISAGAGPLIRETIEDFEDYLLIVAKKLDSHTFKQVRAYINNHLNTATEELVNETNEKYYEIMKEVILDYNDLELTFDEFIEFAKTEEYKKVIEMQLDLVMSDMLEEFIEIITKNPDITLEQAQEELTKKR